MSKKRSHGTAPLRAAVCFLAIFFIPFVASAQAQSFQLLMSLSDDRSNPIVLDGATVAGDIYVTAMDAAGIAIYAFFFDDSANIWGAATTPSSTPPATPGTSSSTSLRK